MELKKVQCPWPASGRCDYCGTGQMYQAWEFFIEKDIDIHRIRSTRTTRQRQGGRQEEVKVSYSRSDGKVLAEKQKTGR